MISFTYIYLVSWNSEIVRVFIGIDIELLHIYLVLLLHVCF